LITHHGKTP